MGEDDVQTAPARNAHAFESSSSQHLTKVALGPGLIIGGVHIHLLNLTRAAAVPRHLEVTTPEVQLELALGPVLRATPSEHVSVAAATRPSAAHRHPFTVKHELAAPDPTACPTGPAWVKGNEGLHGAVQTRAVGVFHEPVERWQLALRGDGSSIHHGVLSIKFRAQELGTGILYSEIGC